MNHQYDIIIIGGGAVSLCFACLLKDSHLNILILEKVAAPQPPQEASFKQRAINHASQQVIARTGCWSALSASPYTEMRVWENESDNEMHFSSADIHQKNLGHIVSYDELHYACYQQLLKQANVTIQHGASAKTFFQLGSRSYLTLEDGSQLEAALIIAADGKNSWLRQQANISLTYKNYYQKALVVNVITERPHQQTAWQRFLPEGPLAFLPLLNAHQSSLVWTNDSYTSELLCEMDEAAFKQLLAEKFQHRLGEIKEISQRFAFPLVMQYARQYVKAGLALMGDAAHVIHPMAGLGLNLGLLDAACLADVLLNAQAKTQDIGNLNVLRRYERQRKTEDTKTLLFVDKVKELFASEQQAIKSLRHIGLLAINEMSLVKEFFALQALG